jgi:DNA-binding transcriptional regulator of glucitol operon
MTRWQFSVLVTLGILCLCLSLVTIVFARENRRLQEAVQAQQVIINKGNLSQQLGTNLVREMAAVAQTDDKIKTLLQDNGFNVSSAPAPAPAPPAGQTP